MEESRQSCRAGCFSEVTSECMRSLGLYKFQTPREVRDIIFILSSMYVRVTVHVKIHNKDSVEHAWHVAVRYVIAGFSGTCPQKNSLLCGELSFNYKLQRPEVTFAFSPLFHDNVAGSSVHSCPSTVKIDNDVAIAWSVVVRAPKQVVIVEGAQPLWTCGWETSRTFPPSDWC